MNTPPLRGTILFVDDESRRSEAYIDELRACKYNVHTETKVDEALRFFQENTNALDLLILDIMMPWGASFSKEETQQGLCTGVCFYKKVREQSPDLPVIVLTNMSSDTVEDMFCSKHHLVLLEKPTTFPYELAEQVQEIMGGVDK